MDVVDLREFYASRLGNTTRRLILNRLKPLMGDMRGATVLGLGFATPYFDALVEDDSRKLAFMMARQGVIHWPAEGAVRSALVDECDLPLLESAIDLAIVVHGLELTDSPSDMLQELWRVLAPQGRLVLVVPNRLGLWASVDSSPFGHGQPFSRPQLGKLLRDARFTVQSWTQALHMPPSRRSLFLSSAGAFEAAGSWVMPRFAGVIIVEAVKQVYAISAGKRVRRPLPRLRPVLLPSPHAFGPSRPLASQPAALPRFKS
jgi:SAM-dependent methyltransferase